MKEKLARGILAAAILSVGAHAVELGVEVAPSAVPPLTVSASVAGAGVSVPLLAPAVPALSAASAAPAQSLAPPAAAAPALGAVAVSPRSAPAAETAPSARRARSATLTAAASAVDDAPAADVVAGRALFDRARFIDEHAPQPLRGAFIQQEQEGSLIAPDRRDSSGDVFRYYAPTELRPGLLAQAQSGLGRFDQAVYAARRFFQWRRGGDAGAWRALPLSGKLAYLDALEAAVRAERGAAAAWNGKVNLILRKTVAAPDFISEHPHMEPPPDAYRAAAGARFLQPEIVSDQARPAASVEQALARTRAVIAETGHAGTQYHVFIKAVPRVLLAQMDRLDGALQIFNDVLFARAAAESERNLSHASLRPWHQGRSRRVRQLLEEAGPDAHVPAADDPDSEKHAFVGLRYWGMEEDRAVVSFELRGASLPWKRPANRAVGGGLESPSLPQRDYSGARELLTFAALYAQALSRGAAPAVAQAPVVLDEAAAEGVLSARARALGMPDGAYDGLSAFARRLGVAEAAPQGWLFAFAASPADGPELRALADELVILAAHAKAAEDSGREENVAHLRYRVWSAYADWARGYERAQDARLLSLVRAAAR